jgi:hypothetical protein
MSAQTEAVKVIEQANLQFSVYSVDIKTTDRDVIKALREKVCKYCAWKILMEMDGSKCHAFRGSRVCESPAIQD